MRGKLVTYKFLARTSFGLIAGALSLSAFGQLQYGSGSYQGSVGDSGWNDAQDGKIGGPAVTVRAPNLAVITEGTFTGGVGGVGEDQTTGNGGPGGYALDIEPAAVANIWEGSFIGGPGGQGGSYDYDGSPTGAVGAQGLDVLLNGGTLRIYGTGLTQSTANGVTTVTGSYVDGQPINLSVVVTNKGNLELIPAHSSSMPTSSLAMNLSSGFFRGSSGQSGMNGEDGYWESYWTKGPFDEGPAQWVTVYEGPSSGTDGTDGSVGFMATQGTSLIKEGFLTGGNGGNGGNGGYGEEQGGRGRPPTYSPGAPGGNAGNGAPGLYIGASASVEVQGGIFIGGTAGTAGLGGLGGPAKNGNPGSSAPGILVDGGALKLDGTSFHQTVVGSLTQVTGFYPDGTPMNLTVQAINGGKIAYNQIPLAPNSNIALRWQSASGQFSVWNLDEQSNQKTSYSFSSSPGWSPEAIAMGADGLTRAVWTSSTGTSIFWTLAPDLNSYSQPLTVKTGSATLVDYKIGSNDTPYVLWNNGSTVSLWTMNPDGTTYTTQSFPSEPNMNPTKLAIGFDGVVRILWSDPQGDAVIWTIDPTAAGGYARSESSLPGVTARDLSIGPDGWARLSWFRPGLVVLWSIPSQGGSYISHNFAFDPSYQFVGLNAGVDDRNLLAMQKPGALLLTTIQTDWTFTQNTVNNGNWILANMNAMP